MLRWAIGSWKSISWTWTSPHELLIAGSVDFVTRKPDSLWSNVLILPEFELGTDRKNPGSTGNISLRGRRLEGAIFGGAHLMKADFTGARLAGANFFRADLREAKFECNWGPNFKCAKLQGASLKGAPLQGAFLGSERLGLHASLVAQLQGAELDGAQLQGASLHGAKLQGASLKGAQLQGASLVRVFVWRTKAPTPLEKNLRGALITEPEVWTKAWYAGLEASIKKALADFTRYDALRRIEPLGKEPNEEDAASAKDWDRLAAESQRLAKTYPKELAKLLISIGCEADSPYVIGGLIRQLDDRFRENPAQKTEISRIFLDEAKCPGARGLSEENQAKLRQMRGPEAPQPSSDVARPPG
jgi:hypothetical protein